MLSKIVLGMHSIRVSVKTWAISIMNPLLWFMMEFEKSANIWGSCRSSHTYSLKVQLGEIATKSEEVGHASSFIS